MHSGLETQLNRLPVVGYDKNGLTVKPRHTVAGPSNLHQEGRGGMDVRGVGSVSGVVPTTSVTPTAGSRVAKPSGLQVPRDELDISATGKMLDQLSHSSDVRQERLARIKEAIDNGTYDTDEKLEAALLKLFQAHGIELDET